MVGGIKRTTSLYSKATATRKGSDAAKGSEKRPRGRPKGRGKGGGKMRPPSPSELPFAHSSSEEEVQVEEEAGVEEEEAGVEKEAGMKEETGGTSSSTSSRVWL